MFLRVYTVFRYETVEVRSEVGDIAPPTLPVFICSFRRTELLAHSDKCFCCLDVQTARFPQRRLRVAFFDIILIMMFGWSKIKNAMMAKKVKNKIKKVQKLQNLKAVTSALERLANKEKAKILQRFFKTGKGEYGEGDIFLGIVVPAQRKVAREFGGLPLADIAGLLRSKIHEHRLTALLVLVDQFEQCNDKKRKTIFDFYIKNLQHINNWDLVDLSAPKIVGEYLAGRRASDRQILYKLSVSKNIWSRRVAMISTYAFIRQNDFADTLTIAEKMLIDSHDLIHKSIGWMLREVGKRDEKVLRDFLQKHKSKMPRTALRYAIEKFSKSDRKKYLML